LPSVQGSNSKKPKKNRRNTYVAHSRPPLAPKPHHTPPPCTLNRVFNINAAMKLVNGAPDPGYFAGKVDLVSEHGTGLGASSEGVQRAAHH